MKKFEYKIVNFRPYGMVNIMLTSEHEEKLNELGEEGWELIGLYDTKNARNIVGVFKREKKE